MKHTTSLCKHGVSRGVQVEPIVIRDKCIVCGKEKGLKRAWTNHWCCSELHERSHVSDLHGSMPGAGPVPRPNWVPYHISTEISRRWDDV